MANYALLDENDIVINIISGIDETELIDGIDPETWYGNFHGQRCVRTSRNTLENQHSQGKEPFRKNFACIGYKYDGVGFYSLTPPYPSWITFDQETYSWVAPVAKPNDNKLYFWNEDSLSWITFDNDEFEPQIVE